MKFSLSLGGVFCRKATEPFIPTYIGPSNDKANIRNDFKAVGRDMYKAINDAKIKWHG